MSISDEYRNTEDAQQTVLKEIAELARQLSNFLSSNRRKHKGVIHSCYEYVGRIAEVAIAANHLSFYEFCALYQERLLAIEKSGDRISQKVRHALSVWPTIVTDLSSLDSFPDDVIEKIIAYLNLPCWGMEMSTDDKTSLKAALNPKVHSGSHEATQNIDEPTSSAEKQDDTKIDDGGNEDLPESIQELITLLQEEFAEINDYLETIISVSAKPDSKTQNSALQQYADMLSNYGEAAESIGFDGLGEVCRHIQHTIKKMSKIERCLTKKEAALLDEWSTCVKRYLCSVSDQNRASSLSKILADPIWLVPLANDQTELLETRLMNPKYPSELGVDGAGVTLEVEPQDVSITLPGDLNQELLDALMQEFPEQAEKLSAAIQALADGDDYSHVSTAQHLAHTLKGAGNTVGILGIANIAHRLEDILLVLAKYEVLPSKSLAETMLDATNCLETMGEALLGMGDPPDDAFKILQSIVDWINRIEREGITVATEATEASSDEDGDKESRDHSVQKTSKSEDDDDENSKIPTDPMLRIPTSLIESMTGMASEELILTGHCYEQMRNIKNENKDLLSHCLMLKEIGGELEELVDVKDMSNLLAPQEQSTNFDTMELDQYGELHTHVRQLTEIAVDVSEIAKSFSGHLAHLEELLIAQKKVNRDLHETSLRTRMLPAKTIFSRLKRVIRQTSQSTSKQVTLHINGAETLVSGDMLNYLAEPIMHVLRNAVDHGIEDSKTRTLCNKTSEGSINIDFQNERENIVIRIQDDGAGLNYERIRNTAEAQNLIKAGEEVSEKMLTELIMKLNFSTRSKSTHISGRGIGMNAVSASIGKLGGKLNFESQPGQGCIVTMKIPVPLISTHTLLVRCSMRLIAVTVKDIQQVAYTGHKDFIEEDGQIKIKLDNKTYTIKVLASLLNIPDRRSLQGRRTAPIIILKDTEHTDAILIDGIIDSRERIIKNFGAYIPKLRGILGATVLGDGTVVPVVELSEILYESDYAMGLQQDDEQIEYAKPSVMVVDDSLSVRRSLALLLKDSGYRVREARDGVEAVNILSSMKPDILLVDMEMPKMNGIDLTIYVRNDESVSDIPIIMITSRVAQKHREEAKRAGVDAHLVKPVVEDVLLAEIQRLRSERLN